MKLRFISSILVCLSLLIGHVAAARADWVSDGVPVCTYSRPQQSPRVITDAGANSIITWQDIRNATIYYVYSGKLDADGNDLFGGGYSGTCIYCSGHAYWDTPVLDGSGGAIYPYTSYSSYPPGDIAALRKNGSGVTQWDVRLCSTGGTQGPPEIVPDGSNGAIIVWEDNRNGNWDIYAQRVDTDGNLLWPGDGHPVVVYTGNQRMVDAISDGAGGAIIVWSDYRDGNSDIYTQRFSGNGVLYWTSSGEPVCTDASEQDDLALCSDDANGAVITWCDNRYGNLDIFAQRVDYNGQMLWTADGVSVCSSTGDQETPQIITSNNNCVVISWRDSRSGDDDIYAQRLNSSGTGMWTTQGEPVCTDTGDQVSSSIIYDGQSGAIITWTDYSLSPEAIYAQRIDKYGVALWDAGGAYVGEGSTEHADSDRDGGAIIAYKKDGSDGYGDIYAQRLFGDGSLQSAQVDSISPAQNRHDVPANSNIYVWFDMEMDTSTMNDTTFVVTGQSTGRHSGYVNWDVSTDEIYFVPSEDFASGELVTVVLTPDILSDTGVALEPFSWSFRAEAEGGGRTFPTRDDYKTGNYPLDITGADLNNDGDIDVVTSNLSDSIYVFFNNGDGTLGSYTVYSTGGNDPSSVIAVDYDQDGDLDLVASNTNSSTLALFENTGGGSLAAAALVTVSSSNPDEVVAADFDNDGFFDLATANRGDYEVSVFLNERGPQWYAGSVEYPVPNRPRSITAADLDNDGDFDLATTCQNVDSIAVLLNQGDGTFEPCVLYLSGDLPFEIRSDDLDGDGYVDLVVPNYYDYNIGVYKNLGDGSFTAYTSYSTTDRPRSVCSGDFDDDGDLDLCVPLSLTGPGYIEIMSNTGDGQFNSYEGTRPVGGYPNSVFAADFNSDGLVDLAISDQDSDSLTILLNDVVTATESGDQPPRATALFQNQPNPFNPITRISFELRKASPVSLRIYNVSGRLISVLVEGDLGAGRYERTWNGNNLNGERAASGVYFYMLETDDFSQTRKMVLLR